MKNFYNELQEEMKDLLDLENELTNEEHLKLLEGKKDEFFTMMINNVESYKKEYIEREAELTENLSELHRAVKVLNSKYRDKDYYKQYAINGVLKIMTKSDELVKLKAAKEDNLKCFDDTIALLQQIKDGQLSTTEFSDKLKEYEEALNNTENTLNYKSSLAADFLKGKEEKEDKDENKETEAEAEVEVEAENKPDVEKSEDLHPVVVDGAKEYKKFGLFTKYKAKKDAFEITIGKKPSFKRKVELFFDRSKYSEIAKEYLSIGAMKLENYKSGAAKEKVADYVERNKEVLKEEWIKAKTQVIPEKLKSEEFKRFVRFTEVGVATALLSACTLYFTHPLERFKDFGEQNKKTIEFVDDSKTTSDNEIENETNDKIDDEIDNEMNSDDLAEKLAKIDPEVSTRIAESYVDYNRESMLEKKDPYNSNNKQSFRQSIKFDVNDILAANNAKKANESAIESRNVDEDILGNSTDEILPSENGDRDILDGEIITENNSNKDILDLDDDGNDEILDLDDEILDIEDDILIIDDDNVDILEDRNDQLIDQSDEILTARVDTDPPIMKNIEEIPMKEANAQPPVVTGLESKVVKNKAEKTRLSTVDSDPVKIEGLGLSVDENNKKEEEIVGVETQPVEIEGLGVSVDGVNKEEAVEDKVEEVNEQAEPTMSQEEIQAQIDQLNAEIGKIQSKFRSTRDFDMDVGAQVMQILEANGLSKIAAAGIAGNMFQESRFQTDATNGSHWGLCQWSKGRWAKVNSWMNENGKTGLEGQVEAALYGEEGFAPVVEELKLATTIEDAAKIWQDKYEVCGGQTTTRGAAANIAYKASIIKELENQLTREVAKNQIDDDMER